MNSAFTLLLSFLRIIMIFFLFISCTSEKKHQESSNNTKLKNKVRNLILQKHNTQKLEEIEWDIVKYYALSSMSKSWKTLEPRVIDLKATQQEDKTFGKSVLFKFRYTFLDTTNVKTNDVFYGKYFPEKDSIGNLMYFTVAHSMYFIKTNGKRFI